MGSRLQLIATKPKPLDSHTPAGLLQPGSTSAKSRKGALLRGSEIAEIAATGRRRNADRNNTCIEVASRPLATYSFNGLGCLQLRHLPTSTCVLPKYYPPSPILARSFLFTKLLKCFRGESSSAWPRQLFRSLGVGHPACTRECWSYTSKMQESAPPTSGRRHSHLWKSLFHPL